MHHDNADQNGTAGSGRDGGRGGDDPYEEASASSADTGGGGGYFGGGGGASTIANSVNGAGGGGASFVRPGSQLVSASLGSDAAGTNGNVSLTWQPCEYDLSVTKSADAEKVKANQPVTYTVVITNEGPDPMGGGDFVTVTDENAAGGKLTGVSASGGFDVECDLGKGDTIGVDGVIECTGLDDGQQLKLTYTKSFTALGVVENTVTITDRGDPSNNEATAVVDIVAPKLPDTGSDSDSGSVAIVGLAGGLLATAAGSALLLRRRALM